MDLKERRIPLLKPFLLPKEEMLNAISRVFDSACIGEGSEVRNFEKMLSQYLVQPYILALNSCTSALQLALRLSNVSAGDEVITTPMTCVATNIPILLAGAIPIWTDINPQTGNVEYKEIEKRITKKTKAIMIVDWGGLPCNFDEINKIAAKYQLAVIEDAAHSLGAQYSNKKIGAHADFVCFSFQAVKTITTGDGGALVCRTKDQFERAKKLLWYGIGREWRYTEYDITEPGYKFTMNDITASIGIVQISHLDLVLVIRNRNASLYEKALTGKYSIQTMHTEPKMKSSNWLYTVLVDNRDKFIDMLKDSGVESSVVHRRNDRYTIFAPFKRNDLLGVDEFSKKMVCIPVGHWVTPEDIEYIVEVILKGW